MRSSILSVLLLCGVVLTSCLEDEKLLKVNPFNLNTGDYWIYQTKVIFPDESYQIFDHLDSVWVAGTTTIDGKKYYILESLLEGESYLGDSSDCVIFRRLDIKQIIYSANRDTLQRDELSLRVMTDVGQTTRVLAGRFRTSNCRTLLRRTPEDDGHGSHFPVFDEHFFTAQQYICSEGVGIVKRVQYYIGNTIEYELVRFKNN